MGKQEIQKGIMNINVKADSIKRLPFGAMRNTYLITSNKHKYILKIFDKSKRKQIQSIIKILNKINSEGKITINPINKNVLSFGDSIGFIYPFFDGEIFEKVNIPDKYVEFGKIVGEFSKRTIRLFNVKKKNSDILVKEEIKGFKNTIIFLRKNKRVYSNKIIKLFQRGVALMET